MGADTWKPELTVTDAERFHIWADGGSNVFLTGPGGVGKSFETNRFVERRRKKGLPIAVTASTGVAAILIGGSTVHSWAGIDLGPHPGESFEDAAERLEKRPYRAARRAEDRVRSARCLLIDEISMLPGRILSFLDFWFRRLRGRPDAPFGGCQVIFVGDFLQLSPVRTNQNLPYDWAFQVPVWQEAIDKSIVLEKVHRQTDVDFVRALHAVRLGDTKGDLLSPLRSRVRENPPREMPRLLTHNASVDKWNALMLDDLPDEPIVFNAETSGSPEAVQSLAKNILAPERLELKPGALVMHLVNKRYGLIGERYVVNGAIGTVESIREDVVEVRMADGEDVVQVERHCYSWGHFPPDRGGPAFEQFPLRLAYATTIHKAQGMTIDRAHIDIRAAREPGQTYVAFSRVRTLEGLSLKAWPRGFVISPQAFKFYDSLKPYLGYLNTGDPLLVSAGGAPKPVSADPPPATVSPAISQASPDQGELIAVPARTDYV